MDQVVTVKEPRFKKPGDRAFHLPLLPMLLIFFALMFLRDIGGFSVPRILVTALCALGFLFLRENEDFALLFAVIPFSSHINFNEITLVFFVAFLLRRFNLKFENHFLYLLAILFIELANTLVAGGDVMVFLRFAVLFLAGAFLLLAKIETEQVVRIIRCYVFSTLLICVDVFYVTFSRITFDEFFSFGYRFGRLSSFVSDSAGTLSSFDANEFGAYITVAIYFLVMLWYVRRASFWLALPCGSFLLFCYALTQSRGGLLAILVFGLCFLIGSLRNFKDFSKTLFFIGVCVIILVVLLSGPMANIYERFLYRLSQDDLSGGRFNLWEQILDKQIREPIRFFFGYGTRFYDKLIGEFTAHNTIMDVYASWGIVGIFLILFWHISALSSVSKKSGKPAKFIYYAPFFGFCVSAMGLQFYLVTLLSVVLSLTELAVRLFEIDDDHFQRPKDVRARLKASRKAERSDKASEGRKRV